MDLQFVPLGRVARTHGMNGEVSVVMTADLPVERLIGLECWFTPPPLSIRTSRILGIRPGPKGPLFSFVGVGDIETASALRGCNVLARSVDLPEVEEEFDPVGLRVVDAQRGYVGEITDVIVTGANDVWIVENGPFGPVLMPVIDDVIGEIDEDEGTVQVRLLPGLIEDE
jgi:16S rRNA processing protein RimM